MNRDAYEGPIEPQVKTKMRDDKMLTWAERVNESSLECPPILLPPDFFEPIVLLYEKVMIRRKKV
jgi:hypothetical protein